MRFNTKLALFATLLVLVVALIFQGVALWVQTGAIKKRLSKDREDKILSLRLVAREAILLNDDTVLVQYMDLFRVQPEVAYAEFIGPNGDIQVHSDSLKIGKTPMDDRVQKALAHRSRQTPLVQSYTSEKEEPIVEYALPVMIGINPAVYNGTIRVGFSQKAYDRILKESIRETRVQMRMALFISLVFGVLGAVILAWIITRPIIDLKRGAKQIGEGKLDTRIRVKTKDELKELSDELNIMAKKLGELDEMKRDFVSNVTHELRSPLTSIRGYLDLLLSQESGKLTEIQKDYISVIKNSTVRLARFIDNLLDVAKIEAQRLKLSPEEQDIRELAHEMEVLFKPQLDEKNLSFINGVTTKMSPAFVDRDKLSEVLINLMSNAIKFTPDNGKISITAQEEERYIEMAVEDTGPGIPEDAQKKLFNKFEQVKSNQGMARSQKGTGLGLAIVRGIIEAHGGKIWIESPKKDGPGTAFRFTIPKLTEEIKAKLNLG